MTDRENNYCRLPETTTQRRITLASIISIKLYNVQTICSASHYSLTTLPHWSISLSKQIFIMIIDSVLYIGIPS